MTRYVLDNIKAITIEENHKGCSSEERDHEGRYLRFCFRKPFKGLDWERATVGNYQCILLLNCVSRGNGWEWVKNSGRDISQKAVVLVP